MPAELMSAFNAPMTPRLNTSSLRIDQPDAAFNAIYPSRIRHLADKHFTPISVAKAASEFLVTTAGTKVLDVGSGAGKFCLVGAVHTSGHFTGIEQRQMLVDIGKRVAEVYGIDNVSFIRENIMFIDFRNYDAFYIYNPFYENVDPGQRMDDAVLLNPAHYTSYSMHTCRQLASLPAGARLATYYTPRIIVPPGFELVQSLHNERLELWEKLW